jgi:RNA polymerase sigma-70 factor (ECF subfamily)
MEFNQQALDEFLKSVEKRAFKMAEFAISDPDEALDLVQNTMFKLVQRYAERDEKLWPLLFYRILQNEIKDWKRKAWVRGWFGFTTNETEKLKDESVHVCPERMLQQNSLNTEIHNAIKQLPWRQQQAFLLRSWEQLDVKQTAKVMNCSTGSVKTHYSRAVRYLREQLADVDL